MAIKGFIKHGITHSRPSLSSPLNLSLFHPSSLSLSLSLLPSPFFRTASFILDAFQRGLGASNAFVMIKKGLGENDSSQFFFFFFLSSLTRGKIESTSPFPKGGSTFLVTSSRPSPAFNYGERYLHRDLKNVSYYYAVPVTGASTANGTEL